MSVFPTQLFDTVLDEPVDAELHTQLGLRATLDAEVCWAPARLARRSSIMDLGVPVTSVAQHLHWDWTRKLLPLVDEDLDSPFGSHRLMGIRCREGWQALALFSLIGHHGRLTAGRPDLLYLEYLEVAPWNLKIDLLGQQTELRGCGRQLIDLGVRLSDTLGMSGRLGLHALPQARPFYERCGFQDLGPDPEHQNLSYHEMSTQTADTFLQQKGAAEP